MSRVILIVEDTAALAEALTVALAGLRDVEPVVFGNVTEALRFLAENDNDIAALISDLNLPDGDGFSLTRRLRSMPGQSDLPVILITAEEDPIRPPGPVTDGPNVVLRKPFSMREVRHVLETLL